MGDEVNFYRRPKVAIVCAVPQTFDAFLAPHARRMSSIYDVTLICSGLPRSAAESGVKVHLLDIQRSVSPWRDVRALIQLAHHFHDLRYDLVHSFTPKAGLLSMIAASIAGVSLRLHTFTGQVWATRRGFSRVALKLADRLLATMASHVLADSATQARFIESERIVPSGKIEVLGKGSIVGVDLQRFAPDSGGRTRCRVRLETPPDAVVFLYLGRLNRDKGVVEMAEAFSRVAPRNPNAFLWCVGHDEEGLLPVLQSKSRAVSDRVRILGSTDRPEDVLAAADVLLLPSRREGFGSVIIEAAACGVPALASRIYGIADAVVDGATGLLHSPSSAEAIERGMDCLLADPELRVRLGESARAWVQGNFAEDMVTRALYGFHACRLAEAGFANRGPDTIRML